jgi:pimeloyl-ACP methyl ester carboxylesterase
MADLIRDHRVIVPDLRGLGLSSKPPGGFDKKTQAGDVVGVFTALGVGQIDLVAHDIGNMVAFQFAAQQPERVGRLVLIDAPVPGSRPFGGDRSEPVAVAFPLRWARQETTGRRARAHLPRPLLARVLRRSSQLR